MLDRTRRVATVIPTTSNNTAWTEDGFRASWGNACTKADIPDDLMFHDIRGSALTRWAEAGCEVPEIAAITGHSLTTLRLSSTRITSAGPQRLAVSAVAKLDAPPRRRESHDFKLALTRVIEPTGGPDTELATLEDAARFVGLLLSWRQALPHWDFAAELLLKAAETGRRARH